MDGLAIGRMVHYVDMGGNHYPAVITGIDTHNENISVIEVSLFIMRRDGMAVEVAVPYHDAENPDSCTWHWPEKV